MINTDLGKISCTPKGEWSETSTYDVLDIVEYQHASYVAKTPVPMGTLPTNTGWWMKLVQDGDVGGYYKPESAGSEIRFVASRPDMPAVPNIAIPNGIKINDTTPSGTEVYSSEKIEEILAHPQYNNLVVYADLVSPPDTYQASEKASDIRNFANGGGTVELHATIEGAEQVYGYEGYDNGAVFRRPYIDSKLVERITIRVLENRSIVIERTPFSEYANPIKDTLSGSVIAANDVSAVEHNVKCKVIRNNLLSNGKNIPCVDGYLEFTPPTEPGVYSAEVFNADGSTNGLNLGYNISFNVYDDSGQNRIYNLNGANIILTAEMIAQGTKGVIYYNLADHASISPTVSFQITPNSPKNLYYDYAPDLTAVTVTRQRPDGTDAKTFTPTPDGTVSGMTSLSPNMTILSDNPGVIINATYNKSTEKVLSSIRQEIPYVPEYVDEHNADPSAHEDIRRLIPTVDPELSDTSTNPVENRAVTKALRGKADKEGEWEFIESYAFGYEALWEKPSDWNTNYSKYFQLDRLNTLNVAEYTFIAGETFRKVNYVPVKNFYRNTDHSGNRYNFKSLRVFIGTPLHSDRFSHHIRILENNIDITDVSIYPVTESRTITSFLLLNSNGKIIPYISSVVDYGAAELKTVPNRYSFYNDFNVIDALQIYKYPEIEWLENEVITIYGVRA